MDEEAFRVFLKRKGKKQNVVENHINSVTDFGDFLQGERNKELEEATTEDLEAYVEKIEEEKNLPRFHSIF
ncbi:MAG: phage integrase N-terminal SAM-like domain-containing protein [Candidatus Methanofastidiosia archaeon]|jgi:site-specific recombinase XerD